MSSNDLELYPASYDNTTTAFLGVLNDAIVAEVTEERNGIYELYMEYPRDGGFYDLIQPDMVICSPISAPPGFANVGGAMIPQPFRIYKVNRDESGLMRVYAAHISYWLNSVPVAPFSASGITNALSGLMEHSIQDNPFYITTDKTTSASFVLDHPAPFRSLLAGTEGSILDVFGGGEYEYNRFDIRLWAARGADRGVVIEYGQNLTELDAEDSAESVVTGICPYWQNETDVVVLPEGAVWSDAAANFPYKKTNVIDMSAYFDTKPTVAQLRAKAISYLNANGRGEIKSTVNVSFIPLSGASIGIPNDYEITDDIRLCDIVRVVHKGLGIDTQAKVVRTVWNVLLSRYKEITVGEIESGLAGTIAGLIDAGEGAPSGQYLSRAGGTINGDLSVSGAITEGGTTLAQKYAAKTHNHNGVYLPLSGGAITGDLSVRSLPMVLSSGTVTRQALCPCYIYSSSKRLNIGMPLAAPLKSGATVTCKSLSVAVYLPAGGSPYAYRGGSNYQQLGPSSLISVWNNGASTRSGEVSSVSCDNYGDSIRIKVDFANTLRTNAGSSVLANNSAPTALVEATFTIS